MARASKFVGFVPVGFLAFIAALAVGTVVGGWTADTRAIPVGYGITADQAVAHQIHAVSGYGVDELSGSR